MKETFHLVCPVIIHVVGTEFSSHSHITASHITYLRKLPQCKLFISFACMWDAFCSVSENQLQFAVFPACVWNTQQIDHSSSSSSRTRQANSWNQPLLLDLQCPLVYSATRDERLSKMWWLIRWAVKCCGGETNVQPASKNWSGSRKCACDTDCQSNGANLLFVCFFNLTSCTCACCRNKTTTM